MLSTQTPAPTDLARLNEATIPAGVRGHNRPALGTGIVHIGLGIFHRAHLAVYTAKAVNADGGDWGIFASSRRDETPSAMRAQDLLYSVVDKARAQRRSPCRRCTPPCSAAATPRHWSSLRSARPAPGSSP